MTALALPQILDLVASGAFGSPAHSGSVLALEQLSTEEESALLTILRQHRLQHLFWSAVVDQDLQGTLSKDSREGLKAGFEYCIDHNQAFEWELVHAAMALRAVGLPAIACKGAILARHFYPKRGLRRMHDIDFWLIEPNIERCIATLKEIGFSERSEKAIPDARNFINASGIVLDVHVKMRLFEERGFSLWDVSEEVENNPYRLFVPEAMVVHLIAHMLGHASETGILICWLVDLALVMRKRDINVSRVRELMRDDGSWQVFLRILRTFRELNWIDDCYGLEGELKAVRPIHWEALVRQRRRIMWAGMRGKLRLGRTLLQGREEHAPLPRMMDYLWQPYDWFLEENAQTAGLGAMLIERAE